MTAADAKSSSEADSLAFAAMLDIAHPHKVAIADWARKELDDPQLVERDLSCTFWREGWERIAQKGLLGLLAAPEFGGQGLSLSSAVLQLEGLGLGCRDDGLVFAATYTVLTMGLALERFGSDEQRNEWLPKIVSGKAIGSFSMSEPDSGSNAFSLSTKATKTSDGFVLNGEKAWVTMAPLADVFLVFATTNPEVGRWGISAFLIPADTPGLVVGENQPKMGMRTTPFSNISFTDCAVRFGNAGRRGFGRQHLFFVDGGRARLPPRRQHRRPRASDRRRCRLRADSRTIWPADWLISGRVALNRRDETRTRVGPLVDVQGRSATRAR